MNLFRTILIGLAVWLAWHFLRRLLQRPDAKSPKPQPAQRMVRCARCGMHVPEDQALTGPDGQYCSAEHRDAGRT